MDRRQPELTRVRQDAGSKKTAKFWIQSQCLVPAPRKGRRPGHVLYAPWRGFLERPWFDALFIGGLMARQRTPADELSPPAMRPVFTPAEWKAVADSLRLSPQQARIVGLILEGKGDKQIAASLEMSISTVRTHLGRIFARLGVGDRVELLLHVFSRFRNDNDFLHCHRKQ